MAIVGVGMGVLLQLAGILLVQTGDAAAKFGLGLILLSLPVFIWGCINYADGKGHSKWVGLVGVAGILGLIVLIVMPDQDRTGSRVPWTKVLGLISMMSGFGLALLGLWLDHLGNDVRIERLLHPWPAVFMVLGACLVIGSLPPLVLDRRR